MLETLCCVCLSKNTNSKISENHESFTIITFLQWLVPEVDWKETFDICSNCLTNLTQVYELKELCKKSENYRKKMESSDEIEIMEMDMEILIKPETYNDDNYTDEASEYDLKPLEPLKSSNKTSEKIKIEISDEKEQLNSLELIVVSSMCDSCNLLFTNDEELQEHRKTHVSKEDNLKKGKQNPRNYQCPKCKKYYSYYNIMQAHSESCDGVKRHTRLSKTKWKCKICNKYYTTEKILKAHERTCVEPKDDLTCVDCSTTFESTENYEDHMNRNGKCGKKYRVYSCEICSEQFGLIKELLNHCSDVHDLDAKSVKPFECSKCKVRFHGGTNLLQHQQYHEGNRSYICTFCGKTFITKSDLTVHEYTHFNKRNYKCDLCDRAFNTNKNLRSHILVVHTSPSLWKYECVECNKRFPLKSNFDQHQRRHSGDKKFECHICLKGFVSPGELRKHMGCHSNVRPFKCKLCSKEYKEKRIYSIHLAKVHQIGNVKIPVRVKKFVCHICPSAFFDKQKLNRHLCSHSGVKPYACDNCDKKFSDKYYLKRHKETAHNLFEDKVVVVKSQ